MASTGQPVTSCAEVKAGDKNAADGPYTLQAKENGKWFSVPAFCYGMNTTTPLEYIDIDSRKNLAAFVSDGPTAGATCRPARRTVMQWSRVRWVPAKGVFDLCDQRYANYVAGSYNTDLAVQSLGSSYSCSLIVAAPRNASIDLTATVFELDSTNPNTAYWGFGSPAKTTVRTETKDTIAIAAWAYPGEVYATSFQPERCNIPVDSTAEGCYVDLPLRDSQLLEGLSQCGSYGSLYNNSINGPRALKVKIKAGTPLFTPSTQPSPSASSGAQTTDRPGPGTESGGLAIGAILGIVAGAILLALALAALVVWKIRKNRNAEGYPHTKLEYTPAPMAASALDPPSPVAAPARVMNPERLNPIIPLASIHAVSGSPPSSSTERFDDNIGPSNSQQHDSLPRRAITTVGWSSAVDNTTPPPYLEDPATAHDHYGAVSEKSIALQKFVAEKPGELSFDVGDHVLVTRHFGDGWSSGKLLKTNEWGHFPTAYVRANSS
ncbi:hypothetical protein HDU86_001035 [Geranomyces michiganensis]|nr:hypothetical protein HDU86_001035 [Geranomyces michiganensis]